MTPLPVIEVEGFLISVNLGSLSYSKIKNRDYLDVRQLLWHPPKELLDKKICCPFYASVPEDRGGLDRCTERLNEALHKGTRTSLQTAEGNVITQTVVVRIEKKMKTYIGTKIIKALPMSRADVEARLNRIIGGKETGDGYLVQYEDGYESWSPKDVFDKAYRPMQCLTFGLAIEALRKGLKVCRAGWNGKGMWIVLMPSLHLPPHSQCTEGAKVNDRTAKHIGVDTPLDSQPYISMWTAAKQWQPGWLASQADILAEDWEIVS